MIQRILRKIKAYEAATLSPESPSSSVFGSPKSVNNLKQLLGRQICQAYAENIYYAQTMKDYEAKSSSIPYSGRSNYDHRSRRRESEGSIDVSRRAQNIAARRKSNLNAALMAIQAANRETDDSLTNYKQLDSFSQNEQQPAFSARILSLFGNCQIKNKNKMIDRIAM